MDIEVECTKHSGAFDYRTGGSLEAARLRESETYPTEVIDGEVRVALI